MNNQDEMIQLSKEEAEHIENVAFDGLLIDIDEANDIFIGCVETMTKFASNYNGMDLSKRLREYLKEQI